MTNDSHHAKFSKSLRIAPQQSILELGHLGMPRATYIHIPFCRRRCYYCDFPISVVGDRLQGEASGTISQYVRILCQEIEATPALGKPLETIFFGGGTPSLLSSSQLAQILEKLKQKFGISPKVEISMEIDPGTFTLAQLQGYLAVGVNRFSLGVQAFQSELLQACGRSHDVNDIWQAVELIRQANVTNFSFDLISGLPHQTLAQWQESLEKAVAIAPNHISIYDLTIEPGTVFGRYYQPGANPLPSDELTVEMYCLAQQMLTTSGYEHYEISNYAQANFQCCHNRTYWENRPYYGFGMGAASYTNNQRFTRPRKTKEYYQWVEDFIAAGGVLDCPQTPPEEVLLDILMLGFRLREGISLSALSQFGDEKIQQLWTCLQPYLHRGWVEMAGAIAQPYYGKGWNKVIGNMFHGENLVGDWRLRLTDPQGFLFSNVVLADLFEKLA
jgi:putative oxygen-independent coproporphyrinogen III oxidase